MSNRSQAVQYITWGLLLVIGSFVLFFTSFLIQNPLIALIIGGALIAVGIAHFKKNGMLAVILILAGILFAMRRFIPGVLSFISWAALILGVIALIAGFLKVKK